jgi:hypothetical protein
VQRLLRVLATTTVKDGNFLPQFKKAARGEEGEQETPRPRGKQ